VPLLPPLHDAVLCAPFPFLYGVLSAQSVDLSTGVVCFDLDRGSVDGKLLAPLPPALASLLERTLRAPPSLFAESQGCDAAAQACLAVTTSLLRGALDLRKEAWAGASSDGGELERLDEAVDALATAFIESKPKGAERRFAQLLCETATFKEWAGHAVQPRDRWPAWMAEFDRLAATDFGGGGEAAVGRRTTVA